jgi:hypothetical protein
MGSFLGAVFCSIGPHVCFYAYTMLFCYYGSIGYFEISFCDTPSISLFTQDYFGCSLSFVFPYEFWIFFPTSVKNAIDILMGLK